MNWRELGITWRDIGLVVIATCGMYAAVVASVRVRGQRSLANVAAFDLAVTIAVGSVVGRVVLVRTSLAAGAVGLVVLFAAQASAVGLRNRTRFGHIVDNPPVLLARHGELDADGLRRAHLRPRDIHERVRMSGRGDLGSVAAVVLERNGSISVIGTEEPIDDEVFDDVPGWSSPVRH